jgi:hypothetical protein
VNDFESFKCCGGSCIGSGAHVGSAKAGNSRAPRREHLLRDDRTG